MLHAEDIWFRYGRRRPWVLAGVDLRIEAGEVVGLCGPSGGGKSTLGRVLAGFVTPDSGRVTVDGREPAARRGPHPVQLVLQHPERAMDPRWTVRQVLAASGAGEKQLSELDPGLVSPGWLDRYPHEISGGELQRVNLARALLTRPRFVVADEITASLDPLTQARTWTLLLDHCRAAGSGVLAISHDRSLLAAVTGRIIDWDAVAAPGPQESVGQ